MVAGVGFEPCKSMSGCSIFTSVKQIEVLPIYKPQSDKSSKELHIIELAPQTKGRIEQVNLLTEEISLLTLEDRVYYETLVERLTYIFYSMSRGRHSGKLAERLSLINKISLQVYANQSIKATAAEIETTYLNIETYVDNRLVIGSVALNIIRSNLQSAEETSPYDRLPSIKNLDPSLLYQLNHKQRIVLDALAERVELTREASRFLDIIGRDRKTDGYNHVRFPFRVFEGYGTLEIIADQYEEILNGPDAPYEISFNGYRKVLIEYNNSIRRLLVHRKVESLTSSSRVIAAYNILLNDGEPIPKLGSLLTPARSDTVICHLRNSIRELLNNHADDDAVRTVLIFGQESTHNLSEEEKNVFIEDFIYKILKSYAIQPDTFIRDYTSQLGSDLPSYDIGGITSALSLIVKFIFMKIGNHRANIDSHIRLFTAGYSEQRFLINSLRNF